MKFLFQVHDITASDVTKSPKNAVAILDKHEQQLSSIVSEMKNTINTLVTGQLDNVLHTINAKHTPPPETTSIVQILEKKVEELIGLFNSAQRLVNLCLI